MKSFSCCLCLWMCMTVSICFGQSSFYKAKAIQRKGEMVKIKLYAYDSQYHLEMRKHKRLSIWEIKGKVSGSLRRLDSTSNAWLLQMEQASIRITPASGQIPSRFGWVITNGSDSLMLEKLNPANQQAFTDQKAAGLYQALSYGQGEFGHSGGIHAQLLLLNFVQLHPAKLQMRVEIAAQQESCAIACQVAAAFISIRMLETQLMPE